MNGKIQYVDKISKIPLMGVDFLGIIDRGTNVIELKPLTLCNLQCKYCFVNSGKYNTNFVVDSNYLIEKVLDLVQIKGDYSLEIHFSPYGEILLYKELESLLKRLSDIKGISIISMQTNGLLLSKPVIDKLKKSKLTRINISLNSLKEETDCYLCNCTQYDVDKLIKNIYTLMNSNIQVLIAPVWFPGENDKDIEEIIEFVLNVRNEGYSKSQLQIGIQKYLIYKTGRTLKKIQPKSWDYFYSYLSKLEKKFNIKLKLGPKDFGIHKRKRVSTLDLQKKDLLKIEIVSKGRWENECIGKINDSLGIKVLLKKPLVFSEPLIGKVIEAEVIKANYKDNILTAIFPL
ncbi:MAG TPA: radical SAM protein [Candidatus Nanopelagicaceae bacterium]|nr:radical SAM protein [Candidatus Nanopelagicaceae bacterium]